MKRHIDLQNILIYSLIVLLIAGFAYSVVKFSRSWSYKFKYESLVKQTIKDMVKEEALKQNKGD